MTFIEVSLVENIQRKSMSPLDEANAFKAYVAGVESLILRQK